MLSADVEVELLAWLMANCKESFRESVRQLQDGVPLARAVSKSDAKVIENLCAGRLVHGAPSLVRRTVRPAWKILEHTGPLHPDIVANARAILLEVPAQDVA